MYISVSTIALIVFVTFMVDVSRSAARARIAQELHQNAQFVMDRLGQEVRSSKVIITTEPPSKFNADVGSLALTTSSGTHTFALSSNVVTLDAAPLTSPSVLVTMLKFTNASPAVTVQLHVEENNLSIPEASRQSIDLQTTLVPRQAVY